MRIPRPLMVVTVLLAVLAGNVAAAKETARDKHTEHARILGGHMFVPLSNVAWPFITTHFGITVGGGMHRTKAVGIDTEGNATTESLNLAALTEQIELSLGLFDRVALSGRFGGLMVAGASLEEILGSGAQFSVYFGGGATVKLVQAGPFILSAGADFQYNDGQFVAPGAALAVALQTFDLQQAQDALLIETSGWFFEPVVAAAVAPIPCFGLQTSFGFTVGETTIQNASESSKGILWGIGVALDLQHAHIPVTFPVGYGLGRTFGDAGTTEHQIEVGVYYSGRTHLDLGASLRTLVGDDDQSRYLGAMRLNYIW